MKTRPVGPVLTGPDLGQPAVHEKRQHPRTLINTMVSYAVDGEDGSRNGLARDISLGGVFIEAPEVPRFGTKIVVLAKLPGDSNELTLPGVVRWVTPSGFGAQFGLLGARETHAITSVLRSRR